MAVLQIYDQLLQFPLFQGMSRDDLEIVAGHIRFGFVKIPAGKSVVKEGEPCSRLMLLTNGSVTVDTFADDRAYRVTERMSAPYMLQPEAAFGYHQRYTHEVVASTDTNLLTIDKEEIVRLLEDFLVFRLNFVNIYATQIQKLTRQSWRKCPQSLTERIIRFFAQHCIHPAGAKTFYILMTRLADEVNDSRLDVSRALNKLQDRGLLTLHRGRIEIPRMEQLLMSPL